MEGDGFSLKIIQTYCTLKCLSKTKFLLGFSDSYISFHVTMLVHTRSETLTTAVDL